MNIVKHKSEIVDLLQELKSKGKTIGFVPTMGALHRGHYELFRQAKKENDFLICSIFINPTQFSDAVEIDNYPKTLDQDIALLNKVKCDFLFIPEQKDLYSEQNIIEKSDLIDLNGLDLTLEGEVRPDHFKGVVFIVKTFFDIINADRAYFGKKDFQQLVIIKHMVNELNLNVQVIGCETVRNENGLALSSRNAKLAEEEIIEASFIYMVLKECKQKLKSLTVEASSSWVLDQFKNHASLTCEYFKIVDSRTLQPVTSLHENKSVVGCIAVKINNVRLRLG